MNGETIGDPVATIRDHLTRGLSVVGWNVASPEPGAASAPFAAGLLAVYTRPLDEERGLLVAVVWVRHDDLAAVRLVATAGLTHPASQRLLYSLAAVENQGFLRGERQIAADVEKPGQSGDAIAQIRRFAEDWSEASRACCFDWESLAAQVASGRAVPMGPGAATDMALDLAFGQERGSVSVAPGTECAVAESVVAIYAAAGQWELAARALRRYEPGDGREPEPHHRRTMRQLRRLIENDSHRLPMTAPIWPEEPSSEQFPSNLRAALSSHLGTAQARQAAIEQAKAMTRGLTRAETRTLLERCLAEHGTSMDAAALDRTLDLLRSKAAPQVALQRARAAAAALLDRRHARPDLLAAVDLAAPSRLEWCRRPERAAFPIRYDARLIQVELLPDAQPHLGGLFSSDRAPGDDTRYVEVWLSLQNEQDGAVLGVHLGVVRIGTLGTGQAAMLAGAFAAAADRDEDLWTLARVTTTSRGEELAVEISLPLPPRTTSGP